MYRKLLFLLTVSIINALLVHSQSKYLITADRLFDGQEMHNDWAVLVEGSKIILVGPKEKMKIPDVTKKSNC